MRGVRVRLQRVCFTDYEMDVDGDIDSGEAAAAALEAAMAGAIPDEMWVMSPITETTVKATAVAEIAPSAMGGREALTTEPEIPADGLPVDEFFAQDETIPPDGLELADDAPPIPLDGLAVEGEVAEEAGAEDDDDGGQAVA